MSKKERGLDGFVERMMQERGDQVACMQKQARLNFRLGLVVGLFFGVLLGVMVVSVFSR